MNSPSLRLCVALTISLASASPLRAETRLDWRPSRTWVFVVGLLEWQRSDLWSPFPEAKKNRRDQQLVGYFRDAGVPAEQSVYLQDAQATRRRIEQKLVELLDQTDEGDLLVFYFCGHGYRDRQSGQTWLANYDAGDTNASGWSVRSVFKTIEDHFNGDRVLILADCCHSGALYDEARRHKDSEIDYAVLTSSYSHNTSTGNWTFSDSVLAGLRGEGQVDLDGDGVVDLHEIAHYCELELAFIEGQKSMFHAVETFPPQARLAGVSRAARPRVGQRIEVEYQGKWYPAKTIDADGQRVKIHYVNYDNSWDEWVGPDRVRPFQPVQFAAGDKVQVRWERDQKWYAASVREAWYGLHLIHYDGFDSTWDEWVGPWAIRLRGE